ncbi:MAG: carboxypeptidase-like regulatory domain-containing protein [Bacteroidota bacterium]
MARYIYLLCAFLCCVSFAHGQRVQGKVIDQDKGEALPFANVSLLKDGVFITGSATDYDGNYVITGFDPGTYSIKVEFVGYSPKQIDGIVIGSKTVPLDIEMLEGELIDEVVVIAYEVPLIEPDNTASGQTLAKEDIENVATRDVSTLISTTAGISSNVREDGNLSIRGARTNDQIIFVDGVRTRGGNAVQARDAEQIQVFTGGLPAEYGDVTGGIINITTKGPSQEFAGYLEVETSEALDAFGYNFVNLALSGPLLQRKVTDSNGNVRKESILGYRFSGIYRTQRDGSPGFLGGSTITDDYRALITADPLLETNQGLNPRLVTIDEEDVILTDDIQNNRTTAYNLNGKIDLRVNKAIDLTFGGNLNIEEDRQAFSSFQTFNSARNPIERDTEWRVFGRFRHRISNPVLEKGEENKNWITNVIYTLQFDFNQTNRLLQDNIHEDNLFDYGYIGSYDRTFNLDNFGPVEDPETGVITIEQLTFSENVGEFSDAGTTNPELSQYLTQYDGLGVNDLRNGFVRSNLYRFTVLNTAFHINQGYPYNEYQETQTNQYSFNAKGGFDLAKPNVANPSRHSIKFGFLYEQREDRQYDMGTGLGTGPLNLWELARQLVNNGIGITDNGTIVNEDMTGPDTILYSYSDVQSTFGTALRERFNIPLDQLVNIDDFSPEDLSLDLFSANELAIVGNNTANIDYYGYDYLGNQIGAGEFSFADFWTARDGRGDLLRPVAPFQPLYLSGYIQDQFSFKDIFFNIGVRVDRYDANQDVLSDPFLLYDARTVAEATDLQHPDNVDQDWVVYVDDINNPQNVTGYREGEQWYSPEGTPVNSPNLIFAGNALPYLVNPSDNIKNDGFDPSGSFEDYEPQVTVMPRVAFSFPISKDAGFFAHYDVLARRPSANSLTTALDYFFFEELVNTGGINNPNLRPEKTVDYEIGFQQRISNSSAIKMSIYYKEQRDMIQFRQFAFAHPVSVYNSFDNLDFSTTKGFTFSYDLRRTKGLRLVFNYTLQFADGTGSSSTSQRGVSSRGIIRTIFPLNFDQRHTFNAIVDYRFGSGDRYRGPRIGNTEILANTGFNILLKGASGRPFTQTNMATVLNGTNIGGNDLNGARLPWTSQVDLQVDRDITIGGKDGKRPMNLNIYVRSQNLLNTENVVNVYTFTQSDSDDGFLASPEGQTELQNAIDADAFGVLYGLRLRNNGFYGLPRRIRLGAILEF